MEIKYDDDDLLGNVLRPSALRTIKPTLSGRSTPRTSPTFRKVPSNRTPRRDGRGGGIGKFQWFRSDRLVYWLLLITLWTYGGFYFQSRWAHGDNKENVATFGNNNLQGEGVDVGNVQRRELVSDVRLADLKGETTSDSLVEEGRSKVDDDMGLGDKENFVLPPRIKPPRIEPPNKKGKRSQPSKRRRPRRRGRTAEEARENDTELPVGELSTTNSTYRMLVGPFGGIEDRVLEWSPEKRMGTCDRNELFARLVWSRNFILVFHEMSMTGAPLSMLELATELLSCGASVHAILLSRRGGLMSELTRRRIKIIEDKAEHSFKAAMKADLVVAGSAVCAQWIEKYLVYYPAGSNQIAWWIMENRREYFDRSKLMLNRVKMLVFLSELQSQQWLAWAKEDNHTMTVQSALIPLSVNDELAFVAGISCSLNTPLWNPERMLERRQMLRSAVRQEMGLTESDMLVISLGSINSPKGQLLLVESANLALEEQPAQTEGHSKTLLEMEQSTSKFHLRGPAQKLRLTKKPSGNLLSDNPNEKSDLVSSNRTDSAEVDITQAIDKVNASQEESAQNLKILIGSVGSKSNKLDYVKDILDFVSEHPNLSKSVLWTPSTTRVASLYSAADVYVTNSQGLGETFGRVTIEAMAFGLPVLGTDAGGTTEIVQQNVTGLLHPLGHPGTKVLAKNLRYLLQNPSLRQQMGLRGREKVEMMYLKRHMYKKFFEVLFKCMRIK